MTAPAQTRSAYPVPCPDLLPQAQALAESLGEIPSRNRIMAEMRIGAPKATWLRAELEAEAQRAADQTRQADPDATGADSELGPNTTADESSQPEVDGHPDTPLEPEPAPTCQRRPVAWPVLLLAAPAFVAIWSGWVELGRLTGFGVVHPLPGIAPDVQLDTAITLPIGVETYAAYALWVWLSGRAPARARRFARVSAIGSLAFGAAGQVAYHLMAAAGITAAPWQITTLVSCLPVAVLGMGAALAHLLHTDD